jgi:hypothetical protein
MDRKLNCVGYEDGDGTEAEWALSLRFDRFGDGRLRGLADDQGRTLEEILVDALAHLEVASEQGRLAAVPPRFLAGREDAGLSVQLAAESPRLDHLRSEARDRHVPLERLVEHALLLYLADLHTGPAPCADAELA